MMALAVLDMFRAIHSMERVMTKGEAFMHYRDTMPEDERKSFDRWLTGNAAAGILFSCAVLAMAFSSGPYPAGPGNAAAQGATKEASFGKLRTLSKECAAQDLQTITNIEDYGNAGSVPSETLAAAHNMMLDARDQCRVSEAEGLRAYGAIDLTFKQATAK
jgi:hypothetical protein